MDPEALKTLLTKYRSAMKGVHCPKGPGRRPPGGGLRQADVDTLLGRPRNTYHRLESGNYPSPPIDLLADIARLYRMTNDDWTLLNLYARGAQPPWPIDTETGLEIPAGWDTVVNSVNSMAYITDHRWNVLAHNAQWAAMFPGRPPANTLLWMMCDPTARHILTGWDEYWAPAVASQLRAARAALPYDDGLAELEHAVYSTPDAARIYDTIGDLLINPDGARRPMTHAALGRGWVDLYAAVIGSAPLGARLMVVRFHAGEQPPPCDGPPLRAPDPALDRERQPPMTVGVPGRGRRTSHQQSGQ